MQNPMKRLAGILGNRSKLRSVLLALLAASGAACGAAPVIDTQMPLMREAPVIDGKISLDEWRDGVVQMGGISLKNKLLALRDVTFFLGCDGKNLYLAQRSEVKPMRIKTPELRKWSVTLLPPGGKKAVKFTVTPDKADNLPEGAVVKQGEDKNFYCCEMAIPLSAFGGSDLANGVWGVQMSRQWNCPNETTVWHLPSASAPLALIRFVPEGLHCNLVNIINERKLGSWLLRWKLHNSTAKPVSVRWMTDVASLEAPVNRADNVTVAPGETKEITFHSIFMPGVYRTFAAEIKDDSTGEILWQRRFSWDFDQARRWFDPDPPHQMHMAVHPSAQTLRVRLFCGNKDKQEQVAKAEVQVRHESGKVMVRKPLKKRSNGDWFLYWKEPEMDQWPEGQYALDILYTDRSGKTQTLTRTFGRYRFEWENNKLGRSEQYIPPFKPLRESGKEIHALLTGYRRSGVFWDAVFAQNENILAAPIELKINGGTFKPLAGRKVPAPFGHVIMENDFRYGDLLLTAVHDYDYDGMCKVTLKFDPKAPVKIDSMYFDIDLKKEYARLYSAMGARLRNNFHGWIPAKEGAVWNSLKGRVLHPSLKGFRPYVWFGEIYKGFCFFAETPYNWSIDPNLPAQTLSVEKDCVRLRVNLVNKPVVRDRKFEIVMGFQPTPVKPQPAIASVPSASARVKYIPKAKLTQWLGAYNYMCQRYEDGLLDAVPNNDWSFLEFMAAQKWKTPEEAQAFALDYVKRNKLDQNEFRSIYDYSPSPSKNMHLSMRAACEIFKATKLHTQYQNPRAVPPNSKESDMYGDEWSLWETRGEDKSRMNHFGNDPNDKYGDWILYSIRKIFKYGFQGIYYDNIYDTPCYNPAKGPAIEYAPGKIMPFYPFFEMRELLKRSALMMHEEKMYLGGYPMLECHITDTTMIPLCSFNATTLDWEMNFGARPYPERFSQAYILTNTTGTQTGTLGRMIVQRDKTIPPKAAEAVEASILAVQFADNLMSGKIYFTAGEAYRNAMDYVYDFGYEADGTVIHPGYASDNPVKISPSHVMATALKRKDGEVLLMIGNVGKAAEAEFDLGSWASGTIYDAQTGDVIGKGSKFTLPVRKYGYRLVRIGAAQPAPSPVAWKNAVRARLEHKGNGIVLSEIRKDHQLIARPLKLDAEKVGAIEIEYRAENIPARTHGQLFFRGDKQKFGSPRVFRLPSLQGDGQFHTIRIDTAANPEWAKTGTVTGLRLDMMDEEGGTIEIRKIEFQK